MRIPLHSWKNPSPAIEPPEAPPAIVLLAPDQTESDPDRDLMRRIAHAFQERGSQVVWRIRAECATGVTKYVAAHKEYTAGELIHRRKPELGREPKRTVHRLFDQVLEKLQKGLFTLKRQAREEDLADIISKLKPGSSVLMAFPKVDDFHEIFLLIAALRLEKPIPCTLHILSAEFSMPGLTESWNALARRLQSGSPFQTLIFHVDRRSPARQQPIGARVAFPVQQLTAAECDSATLVERFGFVRLAELNQRTSQAVSVREFGPLAIQVSALWGRVGSTAIFEAQAKYLVERGFFLVRVFVDHHPHQNSTRNARLKKMVDEDLENVRPHIFFIVERNTSQDGIARVESDPEFLSASPLLRSVLLLSDARAVQREGELLWLGARANIVLVNHLFHLGFAKRLTSAPVILETHDICSRLLDVHGVPSFVPIDEDSQTKRLEEERAIWRQVDACVDLSPHDHEQVRRYAQHAVLARPYFSRRTIKRRCWPSVVARNSLSDSFQSANAFDLMLWGSPHAGNSDSIQWLINHVLRKDARLGTVKVAIVGRVCELLPAHICKDPRIFPFGYIDNIDDLFARSKILVIPDLEGTGISIKAMEVLALGKCFASTNAGFRGIDTSCCEYVPSQNAEALADDLANLLSSPANRAIRAALALTLYEANFSLGAYCSAWDEVIRTTVPNLQERLSWRLSEDVMPSAPDREDKTVNAIKVSDCARPRLSVVICTHNRYNVLPDAIESILHQQMDAALLELIVVDNSTDQSHAAEFARRYEQDQLLYLLEPIQGLSNARNVGLSKARAPIVAFIDDDAIADPKWAEHIVHAFELYGLRRVGVVGGRVLPLWIQQRPKWLSDKLLSYLSVVDWGDELREVNQENWLVGCNIAYNRDELLQVGGFSRALGRYGDGVLLSNEETDVAEKLNAKGLISVYAPEATVHHAIDPDRLSRAWFRRRAAWQAVSDLVKNSQGAADAFQQSQQRLLWTRENRSQAVGFFSEESSAEEFEQEVGLIYDLTIANLCGGATLPQSPVRNDAQVRLLLWRAFLRREAAKFFCTIGLHDYGAKKFNEAQGEIAHLQAKKAEKAEL
jgi:glycosyltransferase involved in cell wall biosynthesis